MLLLKAYAIISVAFAARGGECYQLTWDVFTVLDSSDSAETAIRIDL